MRRALERHAGLPVGWPSVGRTGWLEGALPNRLPLCPPFLPLSCPEQLAASAGIPLKGLLRQRRLTGSWRLKEGTSGVADADRLDLGRASVQLAWFPLQAAAAAAASEGGDEGGSDAGSEAGDGSSGEDASPVGL